MARIRMREEKGFALVSAMVIAAVLMTVAAASLIYSRSDVMVSDNAKQGSTALWIAQLGTERAKNFLRQDAGFKSVTARARSPRRSRGRSGRAPPSPRP